MGLPEDIQIFTEEDIKDQTAGVGPMAEGINFRPTCDMKMNKVFENPGALESCKDESVVDWCEANGSQCVTSLI